MSKIKYITSMSQDIMRTHGDLFLRSWRKHMKGVGITVFSEHALPINNEFTVKSLWENEIWQRWNKAIKLFPVFRGKLGGDRIYQYDLGAFIHKMIASLMAWEEVSQGETLVWIDSDVEFTSPLDPLFVEGLIGDSDMFVLRRPGWISSCTSFVAWKGGSDKCSDYFHVLHQILDSGMLLTSRYWADTFVLDAIIDSLEGIKISDASRWMPEDDRGPINIFNLVFDGIAVHRKGNLKNKLPRNTKTPSRYSQVSEIIRAREPKVVVETGTRDGRMMRDAAYRAPKWELKNVHYLGFDVWESEGKEFHDQEGDPKPIITKSKAADILGSLGIGHIDLVMGDTRVTMGQLEGLLSGEKIDIAFIDGGHSFETIENDLNAILPHMNPLTGIVLLDDYYPGEFGEKFGCRKILEKMPHGVLRLSDTFPKTGEIKIAYIDGALGQIQ